MNQESVSQCTKLETQVDAAVEGHMDSGKLSERGGTARREVLSSIGEGEEEKCGPMKDGHECEKGTVVQEKCSINNKWIWKNTIVSAAYPKLDE